MNEINKKTKVEAQKISVVVPFFNAEKTLALCLKGLSSQHLSPLEVIMVNNDSTDNSAKIAKEFVAENPETFRYLFEFRRGPSYARNTGAKEAKGEIIAFIDSDCVADPNWLKEIYEAFNDLEIGSVAGKIESYETESLLDKFHALFTMKGLSCPQSFTEFTLVKGGFPTANLSVRKDVFIHIGGFEESMKIYSEDYDLCARIYRTGYRIKYTTKAVVYHKHRNTLIGTWKQSFGFGTGHAVILKKHFKRLIIIDLPRYQYFSKKWPLRLWVDMASADKKLLGIVLLSFFWWPLSIFIIFYFIYLYANMDFRLKQKGLNAAFLDKLQLILLLNFKSAAITAGRIVGSFRNRVLCC